MKYPLTTILLLLSIMTVTAQQADSLKFNNRKFKHEIGIDVKDVFGGLKSSALIWKIRNDRGKLISVSYAKNWRFQLYTSSTVNTSGNRQQFDINGVSYSLYNDDFSVFSIHPMVGLERINFFNRFNLYYGADVGFLYSYQRNANNYTGYFIDVNGNAVYYYFQNSKQNFGPTATGFIGMKYRISERFSISVESGLGLSFLFVRTNVHDNTNNNIVSRDSYQSITHSFVPLRFVTFNYHFKQY